jgi:hypothetical protein
MSLTGDNLKERKKFVTWKQELEYTLLETTRNIKMNQSKRKGRGYQRQHQSTCFHLSSNSSPNHILIIRTAKTQTADRILFSFYKPSSSSVWTILAIFQPMIHLFQDAIIHANTQPTFLYQSDAFHNQSPPNSELFIPNNGTLLSLIPCTSTIPDIPT